MMVNKRPSFLLEEELTYKLVGIFIEISRKYGFSFKEKEYQRLLTIQFKIQGIIFKSKPKVALYELKTGQIISYYFPDFVIEDKVIVEIKSQNQIYNNHINQLIRYLGISRYEVGLLVNFGTPKVEIIRRIYTNNRKAFLRR